MRFESWSMSSTATHFTKIFPKRADITGSPAQAFHMQDNRDKYFKYLIRGISAGTIAAIGTLAPGGNFQYLYAPQPLSNKKCFKKYKILIVLDRSTLTHFILTRIFNFFA